MKTKRCPKCEQHQPVEIYQKNRSRPDGLEPYCGPCNRAKDRELAKRPEVKERRRKWAQKNKQSFKNYVEKYPYKKQAQTEVMKALGRGDLVKPDGCESCGGNERIEAHHDDYNFPLEVRWLCRLCHRKWHRENGPGAPVRPSPT